jgi:hypothetical protein
MTNPVRTVYVASRNPTHQSSIMGTTVASRILPWLRLDLTDPLDGIVESLHEFRPRSLVGYPSVLSLLADEQLAGRLHIEPRAVNSRSIARFARTPHGAGPANIDA